MNGMCFYGFSEKKNGKTEEYIKIFKTKIGNRYVALMEEDGIHYHSIPLEDLIKICKTYPLHDTREDEKQYQNLKRLMNAMEEFLNNHPNPK